MANYTPPVILLYVTRSRQGVYTGKTYTQLSGINYFTEIVFVVCFVFNALHTVHIGKVPCYA